MLKPHELGEGGGRHALSIRGPFYDSTEAQNMNQNWVLQGQIFTCYITSLYIRFFHQLF